MRSPSPRRPRSLVVELENSNGTVKIVKVPSGVAVKMTTKALPHSGAPAPEYTVGPVDHTRRKMR